MFDSNSILICQSPPYCRPFTSLCIRVSIKADRFSVACEVEEANTLVWSVAKTSHAWDLLFFWMQKRNFFKKFLFYILYILMIKWKCCYRTRVWRKGRKGKKGRKGETSVCKELFLILKTPAYTRFILCSWFFFLSFFPKLSHALIDLKTDFFFS